MATTAQEELKEFERTVSDSCTPEHVSLVVRAFRAGLEIGVRDDVQGDELNAMEALVLATAKGFEAGCRIRRGRKDKREPIVNATNLEQ